ncbi:DUF6468 domain-containing protein [Azospirillum thermophilum]|uniref:DUF6468 domain-containing protein n=1 Tax=Azospirillum thermophilum TaxID=2202148 RepID=A0A2S2CQP4_9PROT|nr:DUF6468 domain-containing protein [Azospirillum thermophilum]AWK86808.1 hypothetical protein DEW08_11680 [Azospirillum thermophilum]
MSPVISLILDVVIVGLLAATIAYAIILNKQIVHLRESRGEMAELIKGLNEAMSKAETGVRGLKKTAADTGEELQRTVTKAQALRDELQFMIEAADALANRLGAVGDGDRLRAAAAARPAPKPAITARPAPRPIPVPIDDHGEDEDAPASLPSPARRSPAADPLVREGESLSRAERELLQAIENAGKGMG